MAINIPIISEFNDKGIKAAKAAFQNFQTSVGDAQGGLNKFKAGSKSVMDSVAANANTLAIAGGIAFAKFAFDGIKAFQDLALGAEKFATSTGLSIQDASRYIEAAGDIGVPIDAVESAIGKLNKTIGADPDKVRDLGVDLVYLKDGSLDVNATFLKTIERIKGIKDPAEKAKIAAQLLGKGWQSMSTLIDMGADDLKKSLDSVSEAKVINPEELAKAKELRDVMDVLKGKVEDLSLSIGTSLVPVLGDLGAVLDVGLDVRNVFLDIPGAKWTTANLTPLALTKTALGGVKDAAGFVFNLFKDEKEVIPVFADNMRDARDETEKFSRAALNNIPTITNTFDKLRDKVKEVAVEMSADQFERFYEVQKKTIDVINPDKIDNFKLKLDGLAGTMGADTWERFMLNLDDPIVRILPDRLDKVREATERVYFELENASDAWDILTGNLNEEVALDDAKIALNELQAAAALAFGSGSQQLIDDYDAKAAEFAEQLSKISGEMDNISSKAIIFKFKTEGPAAALEYAAYLARGAEYGGLSEFDKLTLAGISGSRASGGPVMGGSSYLVGERGPELFTPSSSGNITPNGAMGGNTITVNVNGGDPNQVVAALQRWVRDNGSVPLAATTAIRR